jgi:flagellar FliL protein
MAEGKIGTAKDVKSAAPAADAKAVRDPKAPDATKSVAAKSVAAKPSPFAGLRSKAGALAAKLKHVLWRKSVLIGGAALALLAVLAGAGAGVYYYVADQPDEGRSGTREAAAAHSKVASHKPPVFVDLDPFTVNLRDGEGERYLQVKLVFEVKDSAAAEQLTSMLPAVRNEILLLLSSKESQQIGSREGKEELARELVAAASKALRGAAPADAIGRVHFSQLIVQ